MQKIIKLSDTHYIGVDDSEIKVGDIVVEKLVTGNYDFFSIDNLNDIDKSTQKVITHSTEPIEFNWSQEGRDVVSKKVFDKIKSLSLSEVEEAINGYSVEKMAAEAVICNGGLITTENETEVAFSYYHQGFKAHKELVKDKFVLSEQQILELIERARVIKDGKDEFDLEGILGLTEVCTHNMDVEHSTSIIKSLLPKTEWEVEFVDGKLKLKQ